MADDTPGAPIEEDVRHDDLEYNPALEPKKAKAWLNLIGGIGRRLRALARPLRQDR